MVVIRARQRLLHEHELCVLGLVVVAVAEVVVVVVVAKRLRISALPFAGSPATIEPRIVVAAVHQGFGFVAIAIVVGSAAVVVVVVVFFLGQRKDHVLLPLPFVLPLPITMATTVPLPLWVFSLAFLFRWCARGFVFFGVRQRQRESERGVPGMRW